VTTLEVEALTAEAFAPFGELIATPGRDPDATGGGWRWWGEESLLAGDGRAWGIGHLELAATALHIDWAERHMRSAEVVLASGGDLLVYVGPPHHREAPERLPPLEEFRVFRLPRGNGVVLDKGVWHGAPFARDGATSALVLLLEGTGRDDVTVVRFPDTPIEVRDELGGREKE
jgi:ureidoglycolate lyase